MTMQDSMPIADAAARLDVSVASVHRWLVKGAKTRKGNLKLEGIKLPGGWRTSEEAVSRFLAALTADAQS